MAEQPIEESTQNPPIQPDPNNPSPLPQKPPPQPAVEEPEELPEVIPPSLDNDGPTT